METTTIITVTEISEDNEKYGEIPDINLRNALKALVPDVFDGDKVLTVAALNTEYFKNNTTLDLSNKGITNLEGLQYFCGYKTSFWMEIIWEKSILVNTQSVPATRQVR